MDKDVSSAPRWTSKRAWALALSLLAVLVLPGSALAAEVSIGGGGTLSFTNANGELNGVTVAVTAAPGHVTRFV